MELRGACIFGQSGGPTSVINASAYGVIRTALDSPAVTRVLGAAHGIKGILGDTLYDMGQEDPRELALLRSTPSSALGSCRYKLRDAAEDEHDYARILEIFRKYDVRYFFYNGGNDSMDTCNKVSKYLLSRGYECRVIGVPKTIDNDLCAIDHCPGYGSAAKYIAASMAEIRQDACVYDTGAVTVVECMGRNAGWLTAAAALPAQIGQGPDLLYLPETVFDLDACLAEIEQVWKKQGNCLVALSEGVRDREGRYLAEYGSEVGADAFGHKQMGGAAAFLAAAVKARLGAKTRAIEFSLLQRCAAHLASATDVREAELLGAEAVRAAPARRDRPDGLAPPRLRRALPRRGRPGAADRRRQRRAQVPARLALPRRPRGHRGFFPLCPAAHPGRAGLLLGKRPAPLRPSPQNPRRMIF
jgi:6-phosphofructokinase 1